MSNVLTKMKTMLGIGEYEEEFDDYESMDEEKSTEQEEVEEKFEMPKVPQSKEKRNTGKVINLQPNVAIPSTMVTIIKPTSFDDSPDICDALKNGKIVVINTTGLENKVARRLIDFVSGASYVLNGDLQQIEAGVCLLTPSSVDVSNDVKEDVTSKALFGWTK